MNTFTLHLSPVRPLAGVLSIILVGWLVAACGGSSASSTPTAQPTATVRATLVPTPRRQQSTATADPTSEVTETPSPASTATQAVPTANGTTVPTSGDGNAETSGAAAQALVAAVASAAGGIQRDVTYCTVDGVDLKMDVILPKHVSGPAPLAVFIHGGGWSSGDKRGGDGFRDMPALLDAGYIVATLNYRLAPEYVFPAMIEDVKCAIRSLRAHAAEYHIDPDRIGLWGMSAGSHLALLTGLSDSSAGFDVGQYLDQSSRVNAVVDMSGPSDLTIDFSATFDAKQYAFGDFDRVKASPVTYVSADDPPILIMQGDQDTVVPLDSGEAQELYDRLTDAGVTTKMVVVKNGPHLLTAPDESPSREELSGMIVDWFNQYVK